jgi:dihydrofolate reductase
MTVTLVAAVGSNRVIGHDGGIPWSLPGEQKRFKDLTIGHVLVMGRKTYDSIGRPLPGRTTVVITRQADWRPADGVHDRVLVAPSLPAALRLAMQIDDEVFVVGGGEIYAAAIADADRLVITWVEQSPDGDAYFPLLDEDVWRAHRREDYAGWSIVHYERNTANEKKL